jgi:ABC-type sulfate transport system permease subunit
MQTELLYFVFYGNKKPSELISEGDTKIIFGIPAIVIVAIIIHTIFQKDDIKKELELIYKIANWKFSKEILTFI